MRIVLSTLQFVLNVKDEKSEEKKGSIMTMYLRKRKEQTLFINYNFVDVYPL